MDEDKHGRAVGLRMLYISLRPGQNSIVKYSSYLTLQYKQDDVSVHGLGIGISVVM